MRTFRGLRGVAVAACAAVGLLAVLASESTASSIKVWVPEKEGTSIVTPTAGVCKAKYTLTEVGTEGKEGAPGKEGAEGKEGKQGKAARDPALPEGGNGWGQSTQDQFHELVEAL
jgi:hypothetical protein